MPRKSYAYAVLEAIAQEMRQNKYMCFFYEYQSAAAVMPTGEVLDMWKEFGTPRTSGWGWPVDEAWYVGCATGIALTGVPVVIWIPYMAMGFVFEHVNQQISKRHYATGGVLSMPLVIRMDGASRSGSTGVTHQDVGQEAMFANMAGIKIVVPSNGYDAKGLMIAAIRDPNPVIFFDYQDVAAGPQPDVPDEAYEVPIGKAVVRQEGKDLTLVAWAPATVDVAQALPEIAQAGISVEYIDLRSIKPWDAEAVYASVRKTGQLLVVEHGNYINSFGSHILSEVAQYVPGVKVKKIAYPDAHVPAAKEMYEWMRPDAPKILDAVKKLKEM